MNALNQARDAMLCLVGSQVALIRRYFPEHVFPGVIRLHFAGGRFPQEHLDFLHTVFPHAQIFNNYGCAEAMPRLTLRKAEDADEAAHVGYALPGIKMKTDEHDRILFRSPYRAVAWIDDDGFHEIYDDEWIPSGDLGEPTEDGGWRLLGRSGDVFKRHGEKISLQQVLNTVNRSWDGEAVCYLETDPNGEQGYVLALAPKPDEKLLREMLLAFRKNYKRTHWPLRIEAMEAMPTLANGKPNARAIAGLKEKQLMWRQRI
jgi:acyl-coenzyme A synthetase/AMP-(fatty) acid ligase